MASTCSNLSALCVDLGSGMDSVAGRSPNNNITQLKQSMTLDLNQVRGLQATGLTPYLSPNSESMKHILGLSQGGNVSATAALLISPGGSFAANLKVTPQSATTPQTPMSFLHPKVIPAEAELFAQ